MVKFERWNRQSSIGNRVGRHSSGTGSQCAGGGKWPKRKATLHLAHAKSNNEPHGRKSPQKRPVGQELILSFVPDAEHVFSMEALLRKWRSS